MNGHGKKHDGFMRYDLVMDFQMKRDPVWCAHVVIDRSRVAGGAL